MRRQDQTCGAHASWTDVVNRTDHAELDSGRERRVFTADVTAASMRRDGFDLFRREWEEQIGEPFPLPPFNSGRTGEYRARVHAAKVHDAAIVDVYGESIFGTLEGALGQEGDWALMHVVQSGHWSYERSSDRSQMTASVGQFIVRHVGAAIVRGGIALEGQGADPARLVSEAADR
jgi:hypothetical protein